MPEPSTTASVTAIEMSEVENFLFGARLGPEVGQQFATVRDPVMDRLVEDLNLLMGPQYFYNLWEIAGDKMCNATPLTQEEGEALREFEQTLRECGAMLRGATIDQWLHTMCRSVKETLVPLPTGQSVPGC
jgi:hypothetical protein